jgi:hypothetical protein
METRIVNKKVVAHDSGPKYIIGIFNEKLNKCHNFIAIKTSKMHSIFCQFI